MNWYKVRAAVALLTRKGARILYAVLGTVSMVAGILILLGLMPVQR
jgi:hypothetical protein